MSSTLAKLKSLTDKSVDNQSQNTQAQMPSNAVSPVASESASELDSLVEQIEAFYEEKEYLNKHFPNKSIRDVVDLAVQWRDQAAQATKAKGGSPISFVPGEVIAAADQLDQATADQLDFGVVEVDDQGVIKIYNDYEAELAGVLKNNAIHKNFFLEVAPCTNNGLFLGRFRKGVENENLSVAFNYTFTYKMRPTPVAAVLYRSPTSGRNYVFIKRR